MCIACAACRPWHLGYATCCPAIRTWKNETLEIIGTASCSLLSLELFSFRSEGSEAYSENTFETCCSHLNVQKQIISWKLQLPLDYHITNIKSTRPCSCLRAFTIFHSYSAKSEKLRNTTSKCALFLCLILASQENAWHAHVQAYSNDSLSESSFDALTWACEMNPTLISSTLVKAQKHHCAAKSEHTKNIYILPSWLMTYLF